MSRCFPFPPPGYEKKARPDDLNLIIKEKHKEKKHKKDKDKKERSERKEKERSEDKRGEKKDRKQKKHEDRKDKKKHKDKHGTSEEKKIVGSFEHQNGEKLGPIGEWGNTIPDAKVFVELQKRIENDCGATESRMVREIIHTDQKSARMVNGESLEINAMGLENGTDSNFSGENREKVEGGALQVEKVEKGKEGKEKNKHKTSDGKRDGHKNRERDKKSKSKDKAQEKEKVKERSKDPSKQRESNGNLLDVHNKPSNLLKERHGSQGSLGKRKEPELNGFSCDNGIPLNKLPRPISSSHQVLQNGISINSSQSSVNLAVEKVGGFQNHTVNIKNLPSQSVGSGRKFEHGQTANHFSAKQRAATSNYVVNNSLVSSHPVLGIREKTEPCQTASKAENLRPEVVNDHKADDKVLPSPLIAESGRRMEINQPNIHTVEYRGAVINHKMDNKDSQVNGIIYPKQYTSSITPSASVKVKENTMKPPHPDSKYLSQILTLPNAEWPEFDDQEWLFGSEGSRAKRPKTAFDQIEGTKEVWAEAIPIKSADVIALPKFSWSALDELLIVAAVKNRFLSRGR
ncbi:Uncharacterized protein Adt_38831 [Abeliophyllum distichum]|uniref:Uncharacterized protein n=1 Tax=Abeliophyllum distichum TaxID=126358 RepID=A0ABD1Q3J6_9LAMI